MTYNDDDEDYGFSQGYYFALKELSEYPVYTYLARNGDAIERRVRGCLKEAVRLRSDGHFGAALAGSMTAIELVVRYFLLRPLLQGAFLSDELSRALIERILPERPSDHDRRLLPAILRAWTIDITHVLLPDRKQVWSEVERLTRVRNRYLHQADPVGEADAISAAVCAEEMMRQLVFSIAARIGLTPTETGEWCLVKQRFDHILDPEERMLNEELNPPRRHEVEDPFS